MFEAAVVVGFLAFLLWKLLRAGRYDFWKVVGQHPDEAYDYFTANDEWVVVDPRDPYARPPEPRSDWNGPTTFFVPRLGGRRINVYGKWEGMKGSQDRFMRLFG